MNEQSIFLAAIDFTDPAERSAYLIKACAGNAALLQNVNALLAAHNKSGDFMDMPALRQMSNDPEVTQAAGSISRDNIDLSYLSPSMRPDSLGTLGHYEILQVLGQGGFGTVLKAFDEKLHRQVAIKVLSRELAATSPPRKRFLREARSVAAIKHDNVISIHSVEELPLPYFVMEFVDGSTLQHKIEESGPFNVPEILHIGKQIASGLAAAHALGLIHRDIKPANILLEKGTMQKVKITDFGLARAADDASMTQSGIIAGTPLYMAPEQAKGGRLDARTDLFSLGSVLYAMATGHPPFRAPSAYAVLRRVTEDSPRPMQEVISDLPSWLVAIVEKLLAKEPDLRFQSAQEIVDLLAQCQSELHAKVPVTAAQKLGSTLPVLEKKSEPKQYPFPVAGVAAGVILMSIVMAAGTFFLNRYKAHNNVAVGPAENKNGTSAVALPVTTDPDRRAAEWVIAQGGSVCVNNDAIDRKSVADLPKDSVTLTSVNLLQNNSITDAGLVHLKGCKDLKVLVLDRTAVTDAGLEQLKDLKSLTNLNLSMTKVTAKGLADFHALVPGCKILHDGSIIETIVLLPAAFKNSIGMEFINVPKGTSWLGGCEGTPGTRKVEMPDDFMIGKYEVTQGEWEAIMGNNPSSFSRNGALKDLVADFSDDELKKMPVEWVSWNDCQEYVEKLNAMMNEADWTYRLPTPDEWEYACRGGPLSNPAESAFSYYFTKPTNIYVSEQANYGFGKPIRRPVPVGRFEANKLGLHDMHGNVWEWCGERASDQSTCDICYRGACWNDDSIFGAQYRDSNASVEFSNFRGNGLGFRLVRVQTERSHVMDMKNLNVGIVPMEPSMETLLTTFKNSVGKKLVNVPKRMGN